MPYLLLGIDDTDWEGGGCTTYVMYSFIKYLDKENHVDSIVGLPRLTRLNPYVPFKTRGGNASLSVIIRVSSEDEARDHVELMESLIDQLTRKEGKTSPGIAYMVIDHAADINGKLVWFYGKSVRDVVTIDLAHRVANSVGAKLRGGRGGSSGIGIAWFHAKGRHVRVHSLQI
ncbi:hypothetical protein [Vulcanisaeta souniana]|uniref:hypothetical protein n=1 Tax=Vulcanisaeta souniana TaxID=164452 RepID=UPI0006D2CA6D|nr:hypothetical protein [Vulcanisaeta souniana]